MLNRRSFAYLCPLLALAPVLAMGCAAPSAEEHETTDQEFSSREAVQLDFELDGELVTDTTWNAKAKIQDQFLYTIGHLNGERSVGRLDKLELTNVQSEAVGDGTYRVTYHARLPVAWGNKNAVPGSYAFKLPRAVSYAGLEAFTTKYKASCVDWSAHDVDSGSMWYYFRPKAGGCALDAGDIVETTATVSPSAANTTGKYPEYHRVWEDGELKVVAIFGKNEDGATEASDAGISAFNAFIRSMRTTLGPLGVTTEPADLAVAPGVSAPDVTFHAALADGKKVRVTALLVDNVRTAGAAFDARYNALSTDADVIMYNGHAGLGSNVRALANKGRFVSGKYLILWMNGCDTFAYVDGSLAQKRAALNPDDTVDGTKYLDIVTNAMPSYFHSNSNASTTLIKGLLSVDAPMTYEQMFSSVDRAQVVLVTGEEDNVFTPGMAIGPVAGGGGFAMEEGGSVAKGEQQRFETPEVPAGKYVVTLDHDAALPGGDADLYVKAGAPPTLSAWDCRPYAGGSKEQCFVTLAAPAKIHAMVVGYAARDNAYKLAIRSVPTPVNAWAGLEESGAVAKNEEKHFETPELDPGTYTFELSGTGDADLYVRTGAAPTSATWDCRPYKNGSAEKCDVVLQDRAKIFAMVRGYAAQSTFKLVGR